MQTQTEIIAVVLPDGTPRTVDALNDFVATGTMLLVRHPDGRMSLEAASPASAFKSRVRSTDHAYKTKPILDPVSREVMGYEMEMMASPALS